MGLGKSVITLSAIFDLTLDSFLVRKVLVIAPFRVARDTWPAEIEKWDHLKGLNYTVAVGTVAQRKRALMKRAQVYIINRENIEWLISRLSLIHIQMCIRDRLQKFPMPEEEWQNYILDQQINDRGIQLDLELVRKAIQCDEQTREEFTSRLKEVTKLENPNSVTQMKTCLLYTSRCV